MNEQGRDSELYQLIFSQRWDDARDLLCSKEVSACKNRSIVFYRDQDGRTPLTLTKRKRNCKSSLPIPDDICFTMVDIGGIDLVMTSDDYNGTILHHIEEPLWIGRSKPVFRHILDIGGKALAMMVDERKETALHKACKENDPPIYIIDSLLKNGGKKLAMMVNFPQKDTALHCVCRQQEPCKEAVVRLIDVGGKDLVVMHDHNKKTALHLLLLNQYIPSIDIVKCMIQVGGEDLFRTSTENHNPLQLPPTIKALPYKETVEYLIDLGGKRLTFMFDDGSRRSAHR